MGKWLQVWITPHILSPFQKAKELDFSSCNPRGKKGCKYINVHVCDTLFLRLSVQRVQLRRQLYFGGSGPACCPLASLTCTSLRGKEMEEGCMVLRCGGRGWCVWMSVCSGAECGVLQSCLHLLLSSPEAAGFCVWARVDRVEPGVKRSKWCCWAEPGSAFFTSAE